MSLCRPGSVRDPVPRALSVRTPSQSFEAMPRSKRGKLHGTRSTVFFRLEAEGQPLSHRQVRQSDRLHLSEMHEDFRKAIVPRDHRETTMRGHELYGASDPGAATVFDRKSVRQSHPFAPFDVGLNHKPPDLDDNPKATSHLRTVSDFDIRQESVLLII